MNTYFIYSAWYEIIEKQIMLLSSFPLRVICCKQYFYTLNQYPKWAAKSSKKRDLFVTYSKTII